MKKLIPIVIAVLCLSATTAPAARIADGYADIRWGTELDQVMKSYPRGNLEKIHNNYLYRQFNPNQEIFLRTFIFDDNKLIAVSLKFNPDFVKKTGIEKLLAKHRKLYGFGTIDRTQAPHVITYFWETPRTRISFGYAPKRPDMTTMLYQQKQSSP
jgi:hypothetical protein